MTLVMTAITHRTVVQLADMRLTNLRTGTVADESAAKMVEYLGRFTYAFTGPACIGRMPAPEWIAGVLRGVPDPEAAPGALARAADRALAYYAPALKRLSIVGGGWLGPVDRARPVYVEVTNWDEATRSLLTRSQVTIRELERDERLGLFWSGVLVPEAVRIATHDRMRRRAGHRDERPEELIAAMVRSARSIAFGQPTVGWRDFLVSSIAQPRQDRPDAGGASFRLVRGTGGGGLTSVPLPAIVASGSGSGEEGAVRGAGTFTPNPCR